MGILRDPQTWELYDESKQPAEPIQPAPARFHTDVRGPFVLIAPNTWVRASSVVAVRSPVPGRADECVLMVAGLGYGETYGPVGEFTSRVPLVDMLNALMVASVPGDRG